MEVYKKSGTKERLFEMMARVNKITLNESFDVPKEKDDKYLDKSVDTDNHLQVTKKDDGVRYPAIDDLKVSDPSLEGTKGDDLPFNEDVADDQVAKDDMDGETAPENNAAPENDGASDGVPAYDQDMGGELPAPDENHPLADVMDSEVDDQIPGGLADDAQPSDFDPEQLAMGLKIEMEHTNDPKLALEIAMDHLVEIPDYYTRLTNMEAEAKGEEESGDASALLDPSTHWVDDYVPKNVGEGNIQYPQGPDDAEAMADDYEEQQQTMQQMNQEQPPMNPQEIKK